jgi:invasion protein IalB
MLCLFRAGARHVPLALCILLCSEFSFAQDIAGTNGDDAAFSSAVFGDWTLKCVTAARTEQSTKNPDHVCEIFQSVAVDDQGQPVEIMSLAVASFSRLKGKARYTLVAVVPLDVHLPSDFRLSAGGTELALARYRNCDNRGCFVLVPLSDKAIKRLKKAMDGGAHFTDIAGRPIKVVFSLRGFTKAFDSLASGAVPALRVTSEPPRKDSP